MTNEQLTEFFATHEWWDNSRVKMVRGCKRKAYYSLIGPTGQGLEGRVGDGANFGSAMHAGLARYYNTWGKADEPARRIFAARAFADEWGNFFPHEKIQLKHRLDRGLTILDAYFDHYLHEDSLYEPIEAELGFCLKVEVGAGTVNPLFGPFWYVGRVDGIFKRISTGELYLRETKTTSSNAEGRLRQLKFDHQPVGYTYCVRNLAGEARKAIAGFMGDVILVSNTKLEFCRDYFPVTVNQADSWRQQLVHTVVDWRRMCLNAIQGDELDLSYFYQDTERCFEYGKCAFYDLCDYGVSADTLAEFEAASWHPLLKRTPTNIEISEEPTWP